MRTPLIRLLLALPLVLGGCATSDLNPFARPEAPRTSPEDYLGQVTGRPGAHVGELVSVLGAVESVERFDGSTVFAVSCHDRDYWFQITYPGPLLPVVKGAHVYFLGRIAGAAKLIQGRPDTVVLVDGMAVLLAGTSEPISQEREDPLVQSWLHGEGPAR